MKICLSRYLKIIAGNQYDNIVYLQRKMGKLTYCRDLHTSSTFTVIFSLNLIAFDIPFSLLSHYLIGSENEANQLITNNSRMKLV